MPGSPSRATSGAAILHSIAPLRARIPSPIPATHAPSGHCRACGYAMDPGRCPECGADCPDVSPLPRPHPWKLFRRAAPLAAIPPALVSLMVVGVHTTTSGASQKSFLQFAIASWAIICPALFLTIVVYTIVQFIKQPRPSRTLKSAAILLLLPFLTLLGIATSWIALFALFAD